jgi:hypothetical protein
LERIVLLATVGALLAAMVAVSALSVNTQDTDQRRSVLPGLRSGTYRKGGGISSGTGDATTL